MWALPTNVAQHCARAQVCVCVRVSGRRSGCPVCFGSHSQTGVPSCSCACAHHPVSPSPAAPAWSNRCGSGTGRKSGSCREMAAAEGTRRVESRWVGRACACPLLHSRDWACLGGESARPVGQGLSAAWEGACGTNRIIYCRGGTNRAIYGKGGPTRPFMAGGVSAWPACRGARAQRASKGAGSFEAGRPLEHGRCAHCVSVQECVCVYV